ncbi:MAG: hypothetical protein HC818_01755 [Synechococcaceae cyanobacterium RM1_1_27]|nr:hypothetical protein [Synechococcaceae cyanobacterium SM2_3_2]NJO85552.1 hypothetical protein [Synechococcaceae cyanobacterium RM1_1_27]
MNRHSVPFERSESRTLVWRAIGAMVAFLNDRLLPQRYHLDADTLHQRFEAVLAWCRSYLADRDPGVVQYRGLPVDPEAWVEPGIPASAEVIYRGCRVPVETFVTGIARPTESAYVPWYQTRIKNWRLRLGFADTDLMQKTPVMQASYRGRDI